MQNSKTLFCFRDIDDQRSPQTYSTRANLGTKSKIGNGKHQGETGESHGETLETRGKTCRNTIVHGGKWSGNRENIALRGSL